MKEKKKFLIRFGDFVVNFRYLFLVLFLGLFLIGIFNFNNVKVNEDLTGYLPKNTETRYGLDIMNSEFEDQISIQLMVSNISLEDAVRLEEKLRGVSQIQTILFDQTKESYKDNKALYTIQVKDAQKIEEVKTSIEELVSDQSYDLYSSSFESAIEGMDIVLLLSVIVIVAILFLTSKTYFSPILAFLVFGVSIVINMGTNFIFGEISFITKAIAVVLQLALSIDYVIIFMNQFMKEIGDTEEKALAIKKTVSKALPEIFASSLTTVSGLLALVFMQLKIGADIGLVLSKGIIWSLLTVILLMPCLLYLFSDLIIKWRRKERTNHSRSEKFSKFILNSRNVILPMFVLLVGAAICLIPKYHFVYNDSTTKAISISKNALALQNIEKVFGKKNSLVLLIENKEKDYAKELELGKKLLENKKITSVLGVGVIPIQENLSLGTKINYLEVAAIFQLDTKQSLGLYQYYAKQRGEENFLEKPEEYRISVIDLLYFLNIYGSNFNLNEGLKSLITESYSQIAPQIGQLESKSYTRFLLNLNVETESEETTKLLGEIRSTSETYYEKVTLVGNSINALDLADSFTFDNGVITCITILFIAIILLFTFRSVGMTLLLILTIEGSILINFGIFSLLGVRVFFMSYVVVSSIQMGATIDYAIIMASRYQSLREKLGKRESIIQMLEEKVPAVITSGLILLIAGYLIGFIATSPVISSIGIFLGTGSLISLIATIFVLPAIFYACDRYLKTFSLKKKKSS